MEQAISARGGLLAELPEEGFPRIGVALGIAVACALLSGCTTLALATGPSGFERWACAAFGAAMGGAFGGLLAPALSSAVLARKAQAIKAHHAKMLREYAAFKSEHPDRDPVGGIGGEEDALAVWRHDACMSMCADAFPREWAERFAQAGGRIPESVDASSLKTEREHFAAYRGACPGKIAVASAIGCAAFGAAWGFGNAYGSHGLSACADLLTLAFFGCAAVAAICDARAYVLPFGLSAAMWALALAAAACMGPAPLLSSILALAMVAAVFWLVKKIMAGLGRARPVGAGDTRTAPAVAALGTPEMALLGLVACVGGQGLYGLAKVAAGKMSKTDPIAMGPWLALWAGIAIALPDLLWLARAIA